MAVNSNSIGHDHYSLMYAYNSSDQVELAWWSDGVSGEGNTDRPGDLAVQLIFKSSQEKTPAPAITYTSDNGTYYITATATDPNATVTLTVNGTTATGTGQVQIPVGRGDQDYNVTATATAQEEGKAVSDPATETITILASELDPTPAPSINSQVLDLTVEVTGSGTGDVHMYIDGQEVTSPYYLERGDTEYTVTVTVTSQIDDGQHAMSSTTQTIVVPPLDNIEELLEGWTQLPGTYTNDRVINWNDNLMFVDRFTASTAQNNHPTNYKYVMTENKTDGRTTNEHIIPVQKTGGKILPYYSESDVAADIDGEHIEPFVMNANAELYLDQSSDIYYYTLNRSVNSTDDADFIELTKLQRNTNNTYREMGNFYTYGEQFDYGTRERLDSVTGLYTGTYGTNFMSYVPIVWTLGNDPANERLNWENDHKHNSYGSPIWKIGAPKVTIINIEAQRQVGPEGSTTWEGVGGQCSLFFLGVDALGEVPSPGTTNIQCEPYMFRIWIQSESNKLRGCTLIPADPDRPVKPGEHWEGDGTAYGNEPVLVYEGLTSDGHLFLDLQAMAEGNNEPWGEKIQFGALDDIDDLQVFIRFYYQSNGQAMEAQNGYYMRGNRGGGGFGAGDGSGSPGISTSVINIFDNINKVVESVTYVNAQGMTSNKPFDGLNIVITRYTDGTTKSTKVVR